VLQAEQSFRGQASFKEAKVVFWNELKDIFLMEDQELVLYVVQSDGQSILRQKYPPNETDPAMQYIWQPGPAGRTMARGSRGNLSEMYMYRLSEAEPYVMARLAFHELMHNKLNMGQELHTDGGFGIASAEVGSHNPLANLRGAQANNRKNWKKDAKYLPAVPTVRWGLDMNDLNWRNSRLMFEAMPKKVPQVVTTD
jgi:hypothetical protein